MLRGWLLVLQAPEEGAVHRGRVSSSYALETLSGGDYGAGGLFSALRKEPERVTRQNGLRDLCIQW